MIGYSETRTSSNTGTNACGRLLRVDDGTGYQTFAYDRLGNVAENTRTIALPFEDLVAADLMFSASLSKHPMDVSSYDAVEFRDFKSQYATVADCKSATTEAVGLIAWGLFDCIYGDNVFN